MSAASAPMRSSWEEVYQAALVENDREKLTGLVRAVEVAIVRRRRELTSGPEHPLAGIEENDKERTAMGLAAQEILKIKTERLGWPPVRPSPGGSDCPDVIDRIRRVEAIHHWHR
jgi:hypothetical protein